MRNGKNRFYNIFRTCILAFCLILLATCDVGLGTTVDTNVPTVTITSPTPSQVVKGLISLGGVATDDVAISTLRLTFKMEGGGFL